MEQGPSRSGGLPGWARLVLCAAVIALGCYRPFGGGTLMMQRAVEARQLYREASFGWEQLQGESVSLLAARVSFGQETYGRPLEQGLTEALQAHLDAERIVHPNLLSSRINRAGLARDYGEMLSTYAETNILDLETLQRVSEVAGVRYLLLPILVDFNEQLTTRISVFGVKLGKTARASARFQLQIWDGVSGGIVWEGLADLTLAQELLRERPIHFEDLVRATWDSVLEQIPGDAAP